MPEKSAHKKSPQKTPTGLEPAYAELHAISNFTFLRGASFPEELIEQATSLGYQAIAITDECSLAGVVRAHMAAKQRDIKLIIGSEFLLEDGCKLVLLASNRKGYGELSHLISCARQAAGKGEYRIDRVMLEDNLPEDCLVLWVAEEKRSRSRPEGGKRGRLQLEKERNRAQPEGGTSRPQREEERSRSQLQWLQTLFPARLWIAVELLLRGNDRLKLRRLEKLGDKFGIPLCAAGGVYMHSAQRREVQDTLTAIRQVKPIAELGFDAEPNGQRHLRSIEQMVKLYPPELFEATVEIARRCDFSLDELRYEYPSELVPANHSAHSWLRKLTEEGVKQRWPEGISAKNRKLIEHEMVLIKELRYEHFFLTVYDIVKFANEENIYCQGRGSAANSVVCYCLGITAVDPDRAQLLFERFLSTERDEPPDIDVDFENDRREEVIQYIYEKYGRHRTAIAATVVSYRPRSAIRDIGKALGLEQELIDHLAKSIFWWGADLKEQLSDSNVDHNDPTIVRLVSLAQSIMGFPRHLSQHVGGFIISQGPLTQLVPIENAAMADRTIIQWDKDDLESLGLLKVDVLALGMLTAIHKAIDLINCYSPQKIDRTSILREEEDGKVYDMICEADTVGVFQIESRAQMSMLPRLRPRSYYDLVIQIAIVRPGPIQGEMVHPYLERRKDPSKVHYESEAIKDALERTLGVPIFQEQVMKIAMVAAGFTPGEADQLRRAMAAWKKKGGIEPFKERLVSGMLDRDYSESFALRIYNHIKGFGEYGFPESHSASFALIAYVSCWLKYYHPAAFCCALLNSQPMGFYPPAQLVQDARRHGVVVLPVDVNESEYDCSLVNASDLLVPPSDPPVPPELQLGFRMVKGLSKAGAETISEARIFADFMNVQDLVGRTGLNKRDLESLAAADALKQLSGDRYRSFWQVAGVEKPLPLWEVENWGQSKNSSTDGSSVQIGAAKFYSDPNFLSEPDVMLPVPSEANNIVADYCSTGFTLRRHPLALLRPHLDRYHVVPAKDLSQIENGSHIKATGIVTSRQRPQTAAGVTFLTLEDEGGFVNVVVWPKLAEKYRPVVRQAMLIGVVGEIQISEKVTHLIARRLFDLTPWLGAMELSSRNFT